MGIRAALGARPIDLLSLVLSEGMRTTLVGTAIGLLGAWALSNALTTQLYEVRHLDARTYAAVAALVFTVALAATLIPAWRARAQRQDTVLRLS